MITKYFQNNTKKGLILLTGVVFIILFFSYTKFFQPCVFFDEKNIKKQSEKWEDCIDIWGGKVAYAFFKQSNKTVPNQYKHINAHMFGTALYAKFGLSNALWVCGHDYWEGCFHEILSRALLKSGYMSLPSIFEMCKKRFPDSYSKTCLHGLGHGIVVSFGYAFENLPTALNFCSRYLPDDDGKEEAQKLGSDYFGSECYQGVFMEYNERTMLPELGPRAFDPHDIHAPCNTLDTEYKMTCYLRLALHLWPYNISNADVTSKYNKMISWCRNIPEAEYHYACVSGVRTSVFFIPEISPREKKGILNLVDDALQSVKIFSAET